MNAYQAAARMRARWNATIEHKMVGDDDTRFVWWIFACGELDPLAAIELKFVQEYVEGGTLDASYEFLAMMREAAKRRPELAYNPNRYPDPESWLFAGLNETQQEIYAELYPADRQ